jgi:hypothetical protein
MALDLVDAPDNPYARMSIARYSRGPCGPLLARPPEAIYRSQPERDCSKSSADRKPPQSPRCERLDSQPRGVEILFDFFLTHALIIVPPGEDAGDEGGPFEPDFSAASLPWRRYRTAAGLAND